MCRGTFARSTDDFETGAPMRRCTGKMSWCPRRGGNAAQGLVVVAVAEVLVVVAVFVVMVLLVSVVVGRAWATCSASNSAGDGLKLTTWHASHPCTRPHLNVK